MQRPIEYRIWHKAAKQMRQVTYINFARNEVGFDSIDFITEPMHAVDIDLDSNKVKYAESSRVIESCSINEVELMEFTGLLDKNGTKVFEDDIVESIYPWKINGERRRVVKWKTV